MHEKDVELAKLLLSKLEGLHLREQELQGALAQVEGELDKMHQAREERSQYLEILSRAAQLLNREDLREELPETSELEDRAGALREQLAELQQDIAQYRGLVDDLGQRAPHLLSLAKGEAPVEAEVHEPDEAAEVAPEADPAPELEAETEAATDTADEAEPLMEDAPPLLEEATEADIAADDAAASEPEVAEAVEISTADESVADDSAAETAVEASAAEAAEAAVEADNSEAAVTVPSPLSGPEQEAIDASLRRFNLLSLKRREAFTHGRGAAYIIDTSSVLERVPNYDHYVRGIDEQSAREELIRDFDILGRELSGSFHLVYSSWFQHAIAHGANVTVEFGTGEGEGTKAASDRRLRELVFEMTAKLRPVCVVTGDQALQESVRGQGIHIIQLGEFFSA